MVAIRFTQAGMMIICCLAYLATVISAVGCGEYLNGSDPNIDSLTCSDWQCSLNVSGYCVRGYDLNHTCADDSECYLNLKCSNGTCVDAPAATQDVGIGLVGAMLGILCFGSSFVPIKKYKRFAGDGIFAQFLMNIGRFAVGLIIMFTRTNRWFYWQAAVGGAVWSLGNALGVPIVQCIGVGLGVSIWGCTNMLLGWASGHFGLLGVKQETASKPVLEYLSVAFSFVSIVLFIFVKPVQQLQHKGQKADEGEEAEPDSTATPSPDTEKMPLFARDDESSMSTIKSESRLVNSTPSKASMAATLGAKRARILGVSMALVAGCLFGICMDPAQAVMSHYGTMTAEEDVKYTPYGLDYVFSNNCGALAMSLIMLLTHTTLHNFQLVPFEKYFDPVQHTKLILPAIAAGAIGSCGTAAWFFANQNLGLIVSFPIIAAGPGVISSLWGAIVFKEIHGWQNFLILAFAFACVISAGVCSSLSK